MPDVSQHPADMWNVRSYQSGDRESVMALADRLLEGAASWRDTARWMTAVRGWVAHSIETSTADDHALLVAVGDGRVVGFVAVSASAEGHGAGCALLEAAEGWAARRGHERVTLETGARNTRARMLYSRAGYTEEDVRLTKLIAASGGPPY